MIGPYEIVAIGASAGAFEALSCILPKLDETFPLPVLVVVHLPADDKRSTLVELMQAKCKMRVCEAEDKVPIQNGTIYFAPPDYHLLVEPDKRLSLSSEEAVLHSRPSIDVLFESAADVYGSSLIGIILSGANNDGAKGLHAVLRAGGAGLVQKPAGAYAPYMPQAALEASPNAKALSLEQISSFLTDGGAS